MAEAATQALKKLQIDKPQDYTGKVDGRSTIFLLEVAKNSTIYRYDVTIIKKPEKKPEKELTKQNDAGMRAAQRQCCNDIIDALFRKSNSFGTKDGKFFYDGKRNLFVTKEIKMKKKTTLTSADLEERANNFLRREPVDVEIIANERVSELNYSDFSSALVQDVSVQADHSVRTVLEIMTSQFLISSGEYQYISSGSLFENQTRDLVPGMQMRLGFKKGVRIGGSPTNPSALMVLDMKRTAFFSQKNLRDIYNDFLRADSRNGRYNFERHMKGVRVVISYDTSRTFIIGGLTRDPVNSPGYNIGGKSLPEFMLDSKKIRLQNPNFPGVHPLQPNGKKIVYSLEVLDVLFGQLVPVEKLTFDASRKLLLENSVSSNDRYNYVLQQAKKVGTGDAAQFLKNFGVQIKIDSNQIDINQRKLPKIKLRGEVITPNTDGSWLTKAKDAKFTDPSKSWKGWIVAYDERANTNETAIRSYIKALTDVAKKAGMVVEEPKKYVKTSLSALEDLFKNPPAGLRFILYIDDQQTKSHEKFKLFEAYYKILTQHIVTKNLDTSKQQTLKNVVMKINAKFAGICYVPEVEKDMKDDWLENDEVLIIGLDVAHPQRLAPKEKFNLKKKHPELDNLHPSCVGVSSNKMTHKYAFAGDFFYQQTNKESIDPIRLQRSVEELVAKSKKKPTKILVFRDGLSEGQQQKAVDEEVSAVRLGIRAVHPTLDPKITFVVATKDHNKRFYRFTKGDSNTNGVSNTEPGDIIDSKVVREDVLEFYQQAHYPLKGVPKMLQIAVLVNENQIPTSTIQRMLIYLSNIHQICACPTSLPLPVLLAHETAKRGMSIYNELCSIRIPPQSNRNQPQQPSNFAPELKNIDGIFNFDELTKVLGYANSKLCTTRWNA